MVDEKRGKNKRDTIIMGVIIRYTGSGYNSNCYFKIVKNNSQTTGKSRGLSCV